MKSAILVALIYLSLITNSSANDFEIKSFHADITIDADGTFEVKETIDIFFNEKRRGIYRLIPYQYLIKGNKYNIKITDINVESETTKITNENKNKKIRIGESDIFIEGHKTYYINYKVTKALIEHEDSFEFYWNITGNDWDVPMNVAGFTISYPDDILLEAGDVRILADDYGTTFTAIDYEIMRNQIKGKSSRPIKAGEGISVATMIDADHFNISPDNLQQIEIPKVYPTDLYFPIPAMLMGWFLLLWKKKDRHNLPTEVDDKYYPPSDMSPTEVGTFYDHQVNNRDILALIPKWGNEGLILLESIPREDEKYDIYFHKKADINTDAPPYEQELFNGLFENNNVIFLEDLKNKFYKIFSVSKAMFSKDMILNQLYDQESKRKFHNPYSLIIWIFLILLGVFLTINFQFFASGILCIVLAIAGILITFSRPKISERGIKIQNHLNGLYNFLKKPRSDQVQNLLNKDASYLDTIFPYVVAFGIDQKWNSKLKTIDGIATNPSWYYESGSKNNQGSMQSFSEAFNPKSIESAFTSSPSSNSSGGGGGVSGSSGGGFGGGGGGSW